jgi:GNAT superfamily N-acetyltransferase
MRGGLRIRRAVPADAARIGALMRNGFDLPKAAAPLFAAVVDRSGWEGVVAECDEGVAGAGLLFVGGTWACLFAGVTAPAYRRRGIQRALVARRVQLALDLGVTGICSETGVAVPGEPNPSWDNLVRAGLLPVHVAEHLCPAGMSWSSEAS